MQKPVRKAEYSRAFVQACKEELAPHIFDRIHARARNRTGGRNAGTSRQAAKDEKKAELMAKRREMKLALAAIEEELSPSVARKAKAMRQNCPMAPTLQASTQRVGGHASRKHGKISQVLKRQKDSPSPELPIVKAGAFSEGDHPRNDHGEFSDGGGGGGGTKPGRSAKFTAKDHDKAADRHRHLANEAADKGDKAAADSHKKQAAYHDFHSGKETARSGALTKTKSGKLIHPDRPAEHPGYSHFGSADHQDAADRHNKDKHTARAAGDRGSATYHGAIAKTHADQAHAMRMVGKAQSSPNAVDTSLRDAQRLVSGMDFEMRNGATSVSEARRRASTGIRRNLTRYDNIFTPDQAIDRLDGLDLDLGSGNARARGYLGLDLYPYDHGTVIQDLSLGLGTAPGTVRSVRLVNTLDGLDDYRDNPLALLLDIQESLQVGGRLFYEGQGALTDMADWAALPGLALTWQDDATAPAALVKQTFERVPIVVPTIHGADPEELGTVTDDESLSMALAAMRTAPSADVAMANLRLKSVDHRPCVAVLKLQKYRQLVTSVVYSPDELDTDGEYMTAEDIETAAHEYMRDYRKIGSEHGPDSIGAHVVESWITPTEIELDGQNGPQKVSAGSWLMTVKVDDAQEWKKVLNGTYTGFSLGGHASLHLDG